MICISLSLFLCLSQPGTTGTLALALAHPLCLTTKLAPIHQPATLSPEHLISELPRERLVHVAHVAHVAHDLDWVAHLILGNLLLGPLPTKVALCVVLRLMRIILGTATTYDTIRRPRPRPQIHPGGLFPLCTLHSALCCLLSVA